MTSPQLAVILASAGRPHLLLDAIRTLGSQTVPFLGVLSVPDEASLPDDPSAIEGWTVVRGTKGLAAQRNAGLDALPPSVRYVAFFDDDAVAHPSYMANAAAFLDSHPRVVALTGRVALDGIGRDEVSLDEALHVIARTSADVDSWRPWRQLYGANFVVRRDVALAERFDARLPLYSWLEDHDFARRCLRHGAVAKVDACVAVHRAASSGGRTAHRRLGYSQVMNPGYLWRKGSFPLWLALEQAGRVVGKNVVRSTLTADRSWRRERLSGNLLGVADLARGRFRPERIVEL